MDAEHRRLPVRLGKWRGAYRQPDSDRTPKGPGRPDPIGMAAVGMEIETERLAGRRRAIGWDPERQIGRTVTPDHDMAAVGSGYPHDAIAPGRRPERQIAQAARPRHRTDQGQCGDVERRRPGDGQALGRWCVRRRSESKGPRGTTSVQADVERGSLSDAPSCERRRAPARRRGGRRRQPRPTSRGNRHCGGPIPKRTRAPRA